MASWVEFSWTNEIGFNIGCDIKAWFEGAATTVILEYLELKYLLASILDVD